MATGTTVRTLTQQFLEAEGSNSAHNRETDRAPKNHKKFEMIIKGNGEEDSPLSSKGSVKTA